MHHLLKALKDHFLGAHFKEVFKERRALAACFLRGERLADRVRDLTIEEVLDTIPCVWFPNAIELVATAYGVAAACDGDAARGVYSTAAGFAVGELIRWWASPPVKNKYPYTSEGQGGDEDISPC